MIERRTLLKTVAALFAVPLAMLRPAQVKAKSMYCVWTPKDGHEETARELVGMTVNGKDVACVGDGDNELTYMLKLIEPLVKDSTKAIAWYAKDIGVPKAIQLTNGARISFYSRYRGVTPPNGRRFVYVWFHDCTERRALDEMRARTLSDNGSICFTSTEWKNTRME